MLGSNLQIIDSDHVLIGTRELKAREYYPPFKDGSTCVIEATSDPTNKYQQKLLPSELHGLKGGNLQKGFQLIIYRPEAHTKGLDYVSFENLSDGRRINIVVYYYFTDWAFRTNLVYFAEDLRALIEQKLPTYQSASVTKDEYGVTIWCSVFLKETEDCFEAYVRIDSAISSLYQEAIQRADQLFVKKLESSPSGSESGLKWWVRYVVVPIVSGGVGAALVGWLLLRA